MLYLRTYVCSAYVYILLTMNIIKKAIGGGTPTALYFSLDTANI